MKIAVMGAAGRMGRELEASRSREAMLARDQERLRHARMLHDRVLQTMETLARGQWIADTTLKARVAEEATQPEGTGLKESIRGRITESGGTVRIDTAPGAGTYLEITMPLASGLHRDSGRGSHQGRGGR